jgi:hypothetical protein
MKRWLELPLPLDYFNSTLHLHSTNRLIRRGYYCYYPSTSRKALTALDELLHPTSSTNDACLLLGLDDPRDHHFRQSPRIQALPIDEPALFLYLERFYNGSVLNNNRPR